MANKVDASKIMKDFKRAYEDKKSSLVKYERDFEFTLGEQWTPTDVQDLKNAGVKALTINKIRPIIWLLIGIESQNRSDYLAYPEGEEDTVLAEIITRLLKNVMKKTGGDYKLSEAFEDGATCGECFIEPYVDYTYDLLNGELKLKKINYDQIYPDPSSVEYDMSDGEFLIKFSPSLTKDQILQLFPDKENKIEKLANVGSKVDLVNFSNLKTIGELQHIQLKDYPNMNDNNITGFDNDEEINYDLIEYYYKKYVKKYFVADRKLGTIREAQSKEEAIKYVEMVNAQKGDDMNSAVVIDRIIPEIWVASMVGNIQMDDTRCMFYPNWKGFPIMPYWCYRSTAPIKRKELKKQGVARGLIDPQEEHNKRRTQELRILNTSANSGWLTEEGSFKDKDMVEKFGSSPGVIVEYKKQLANKPERITPTPLSQGHAQLAAEHSQDMKEISGINTEALAMTDKQASGRAIYLRQKQGLLIVQKLFDNLSQTKRLLGRFILTQLGQLYDIDLAAKVLGDSFIKEHFSEAIVRQQQNPLTGETETIPELDEAGEIKTKINEKAVADILNLILNDASLGKYDVSIGEGANNETIKFANYMTLMEMAEKGLPIPPDVLVDESMLSTGHKAKIVRAIEKQQAAMLREQQAKARSASEGTEIPTPKRQGGA